MEIISQNLHEKIIENWDNFPYKLDYIIHMIFSKNNNARGIQLKINNEIYKVSCIREINEENENFDCDRFFINKNELLAYLNINQSGYHKFVQSFYFTQIFNNQYKFRVQKGIYLNDDLIALQLTQQIGENYNFNEINGEISKYDLYFHLDKNMHEKATISQTKI